MLAIDINRNRLSLRPDRTEYRLTCCRCRRPRSECYCARVEPFESQPRFIILTHPREAKHRLGTARMAHLCLANSSLIEGVNFSANDRVNREIDDPSNLPLLLHLSRSSINLSRLDRIERQRLFLGDRKLIVFVLDGTWKSVRKIIRLSPNLARLPKICFDPPTPSAYRIRREPLPQCYSTLEAIGHVIELLSDRVAPEVPSSRLHDSMLALFHSVIDRQMTFTA